MNLRYFPFAAVLVLAACGGGDGADTAATTAPATTAAPSTTVAPTTVAPTTTEGMKRIVLAVNTCADELFKPLQPGRKALKDSVADNGTTITTDDWAITRCILGYLGAPAYVVDQIGKTRALDGMQRAEWDGLEAMWTYHPDDGLDMTIHDTEG